jgi:hypothetical protein
MILEIPYRHFNTSTPRTIVFGELGEIQFSQKIHTILWGVCSSELTELSPEQRQMVLNCLAVFSADEREETSEAFVMRGGQYGQQ